MTDPPRTYQELLKDNFFLNQRIKELEHSESELKRVHEVLRKSEEKYSQLSENANDAILSLDLDGIIRYANRAASDLASPLNLLGLSMLDITSANFLQNIPELLRKRREGDDSIFAFEWELTAPDSGRNMIMDVHSSLLTENGKPSGVLIVAHDVTEQKLGEKALQESEKRYREIFENIADVFYRTDNEGLLLIVSPSIERLLGYIPDEVIGKKKLIEFYINPEERNQFLSILREKREIKGFKTPLRAKDGAEVWVSTNAQFYRDKHGEIIGVQGIARNITERMQAEEALRIQNKTFSEVLDSLDALVYVVDMNTYEILFINTYGKNIWGDIKGKICWQKIQEGQAAPCEFCTNSQLIGPDGKPTKSIVWEFQNTVNNRWYDCRDKAIYWPDGRIVRMEIATDITERKQTEERLHASLREKEILLSEVHHRVKNNMQVISGLLDLQARSSGSPELTGMLNESKRRIRSMALIHEKLYGSKDFARINLADYVRALSSELIQFHEMNPGEIDLIVQTDGGEVHVDINKAIPCGLILNELISNALKHAFPGDGPGELRIIIHETKNKEIEIVVRDNGLGLPDDVDIHQSRTVGLYLVNGLVSNQLDGQIEVRRDNGTEFRIKFP